MITPEKYRARADELESLKRELEVQKRPGDPAPVVRRVLEAAGDLLRRTQSAPAPAGLVDAALAAVSEPLLDAWAQGFDVAEVRSRLAGAASQAVEAALPDVEADGKALGDWAMEGVRARDRVESALVAVEHLGRTRGDAKALAGRLRSQLDTADAEARRQVPALTALNPARRAESALLDSACRPRAWWFEERSGAKDDLLVKLLGGEGEGALGEKERRADQVVKQKRPRRHSFDELLAVDLGLAGDGAVAALKAEAEKDPELKKVLAAMAEGERAIEELTHGEKPPTAPAQPAHHSESSGPSPQLVLDRAEFKVLVLRPKGRVQVVVTPHRVDRLAAAAVMLPHEGGREVPGVREAAGLLFDLGKAAVLAGHEARVTVELVDGRKFSTEVAL